MVVDGANVSVDRAAKPKEQSKETAFGGSKSITVNRDIEPVLKDVVGGAAVAYSLRDLNDTLGTKPVIRLRRTQDNAESDFTAKEIQDGTSADWVNTLIYNSDFSGGVDNWSGLRATVEASQDYLKVTPSTESNTHMASRNGVFTSGRKHLLKFDIKFPVGNTIVTGFRVLEPSGDTLFTINNETQGEYVSYSFEVTSSGLGALRFLARNNSALTFSGDGEEHFLVRNIKVTDIDDEGFVSKWYDQSGNGADLIQADPTLQPKLISDGSVLTDGVRFDSSTIETTDTFTYGSGSSLSLFALAKHDVAQSGYLARFAGDLIIFNTGGGLRRVNAGAAANAGVVSGNKELDSVFVTLNSSGGTANFYVDGTLTSTADASIGTKTITNRVFNLGGNSSGTWYEGSISEVIVYASNVSSNRRALETNISNEFSIALT
jgi:hypothetical protein